MEMGFHPKTSTCIISSTSILIKKSHANQYATLWENYLSAFLSFVRFALQTKISQSLPASLYLSLSLSLSLSAQSARVVNHNHEVSKLSCRHYWVLPHASTRVPSFHCAIVVACTSSSSVTPWAFGSLGKKERKKREGKNKKRYVRYVQDRPVRLWRNRGPRREWECAHDTHSPALYLAFFHSENSGIQMCHRGYRKKMRWPRKLYILCASLRPSARESLYKVSADPSYGWAIVKFREKRKNKMSVQRLSPSLSFALAFTTAERTERGGETTCKLSRWRLSEKRERGSIYVCRIYARGNVSA